jgi:hypothetical protein
MRGRIIQRLADHFGYLPEKLKNHKEKRDKNQDYRTYRKNR